MKAENIKMKHVFMLTLLAGTISLSGCDQFGGGTNAPETDTPTKDVVSTEVPAQNAGAMTEISNDGATVIVSGPDMEKYALYDDRWDSYEATQNGVLIRSTNEKPAPSGKTRAVKIKLDNDWQDSIIGKTIEITITASPASTSPSEQFAVSYSTNDVGNSGWRRFTVGEEVEAYSFQYKISGETQRPTGDYIGIWADTSASNGGIVVHEISIKTVE